MLRTLLKPLSFLPALIMMYIIFSFSAQEGDVSAQLSYKASVKIVETADYIFDANLDYYQIDEWANKINFITRKLAHMAEYFALAVAVSFPLYVYGMHGILLMLIAGLICVGFACGDEYHQSFVMGRSPSAKDVCIDSVGIFFGIIMVRIIGWTGRKTIFKPKTRTKKKRKLFGRRHRTEYYEEYGESYQAPPQNGGGYYQAPPQNGGYYQNPAANGNYYQNQPLNGSYYQNPPLNSGNGPYQNPLQNGNGRYGSSSQEDGTYHRNLAQNGNGYYRNPVQNGNGYYQNPAQNGNGYYQNPAQNNNGYYQNPAQNSNEYYQNPAQNSNEYYRNPAQNGNEYYQNPTQNGNEYYQNPAQNGSGYYQNPTQNGNEHQQSQPQQGYNHNTSQNDSDNYYAPPRSAPQAAQNSPYTPSKSSERRSDPTDPLWQPENEIDFNLKPEYPEREYQLENDPYDNDWGFDDTQKHNIQANASPNPSGPIEKSGDTQSMPPYPQDNIPQAGNPAPPHKKKKKHEKDWFFDM